MNNKFPKLKLKRNSTINNCETNEITSRFFKKSKIESNNLNNINSTLKDNFKISNSQELNSNDNEEKASALLNDTDENVFEPETLKSLKPKKVEQITKKKKQQKKSQQKNKLSFVVKKNEQVVTDDGFSSEELQLAIVQSLSIQQNDSKHEFLDQDIQEDQSNTKTDSLIPSDCGLLGKYGFKRKINQKNGNSILREYKEYTLAKRQQKKSDLRKKHFGILPPTLFQRTEFDRAKLINEKISEIIENSISSNNQQQTNEFYTYEDFECKISCGVCLEGYYSHNNRLFKISQLETKEKHAYYVKGLVEVSNAKVGCLLKNWATIIGRDKSPEINKHDKLIKNLSDKTNDNRNFENNLKEFTQNRNNKTKDNRNCEFKDNLKEFTQNRNNKTNDNRNFEDNLKEFTQNRNNKTNDNRNFEDNLKEFTQNRNNKTKDNRNCKFKDNLKECAQNVNKKADDCFINGFDEDLKIDKIIKNVLEDQIEGNLVQLTQNIDNGTKIDEIIETKDLDVNIDLKINSKVIKDIIKELPIINKLDEKEIKSMNVIHPKMDNIVKKTNMGKDQSIEDMFSDSFDDDLNNVKIFDKNYQDDFLEASQRLCENNYKIKIKSSQQCEKEKQFLPKKLTKQMNHELIDIVSEDSDDECLKISSIKSEINSENSSKSINTNMKSNNKITSSEKSVHDDFHEIDFKSISEVVSTSQNGHKENVFPIISLIDSDEEINQKLLKNNSNGSDDENSSSENEKYSLKNGSITSDDEKLNSSLKNQKHLSKHSAKASDDEKSNSSLKNQKYCEEVSNLVHDYKISNLDSKIISEVVSTCQNDVKRNVLLNNSENVISLIDSDDEIDQKLSSKNSTKDSDDEKLNSSFKNQKHSPKTSDDEKSNSSLKHSSKNSSITSDDEKSNSSFKNQKYCRVVPNSNDLHECKFSNLDNKSHLKIDSKSYPEVVLTFQNDVDKNLLSENIINLIDSDDKMLNNSSESEHFEMNSNALHGDDVRCNSRLINSTNNFDCLRNELTTSSDKNDCLENDIGSEHLQVSNKEVYVKQSSQIENDEFHKEINGIEPNSRFFKKPTLDVEDQIGKFKKFKFVNLKNRFRKSLSNNDLTSTKNLTIRKSLSFQEHGNNLQRFDSVETLLSSGISDEELNYSCRRFGEKNGSFVDQNVKKLANSIETVTKIDDFDDQLNRRSFNTSSWKRFSSFNENSYCSESSLKLESFHFNQLEQIYNDDCSNVDLENVKKKRKSNQQVLIKNQGTSTEDDLCDAQENREKLLEKDRSCCEDDRGVSMPKFDLMKTPDVKNELRKFGVKSMKRKKGVQLLKYIYEQTNKNKKNDSDDVQTIQSNIQIVGDCRSIRDNDVHLIFERNQSKKIASCAVPFHIVWQNYLNENSEINLKILKYEPIQLEQIYSHFKSIGFKFHINDIMTFLDRRCITIKTCQNAARNNRLKK